MQHPDRKVWVTAVPVPFDTKASPESMVRKIHFAS